MSAPYPAVAVSNYFIGKSLEDEIVLSPMKLQKLLYFSHGVFLGITGEKLIDDNFEAWRYGPVVPHIYRIFKDYRMNPIKSKYSSYEIDPGDEDVRTFLNFMWDGLKDVDALELSDITHLKDSPWDLAWKNGDVIIKNSLIKSYYSDSAEKIVN